MWSDECSVSSTVQTWTPKGMTVRSGFLPHVTNVATEAQNELEPGFVLGWPYSKAHAQKVCPTAPPKFLGTGITCGLVQTHVLIQQVGRGA